MASTSRRWSLSPLLMLNCTQFLCIGTSATREMNDQASISQQCMVRLCCSLITAKLALSSQASMPCKRCHLQPLKTQLPLPRKVVGLIVSGAPASGKGTQCEKIIEEFKTPHLICCALQSKPARPSARKPGLIWTLASLFPIPWSSTL
jgi:hypothetical protein